MNRSRPSLLARGSWPEASRIADLLRTETIGGVLLVAAAIAGIVAANTGDWYADVRDAVVGPSSLHLDLSLGTWAADGLLAIFFFVVGLELKREFVAGDLRDPRRAAVPMVAALGGMVAPAVIFTVVNLGGAQRGWAIPTATDIAFAVAILALLGSHLPAALRTFLLTLAIVDDLLAITVIAIFYTQTLHLQWLALAAVPIAVFAVLVQKRIHSPWLLLPLAVVAWALVHASGVHATVAGVLLGFTVPVLRRDGAEGPGLADHLEHVVRPLSAGVAVPVFAFFSAGVVVSSDALEDAITSPVTIGVVVGLVAGKTIGIMGATWLMSRFTGAELDDDLAWWDLLGLSILAGIGFTVSLLIAELAFGAGSEDTEHAKLGVLLGTLLATLLAAVVLRARERVYRTMAELDTRDDDADGIPDVYQRD